MSEYLDGPNKNKVIEIYNPSDSIINLIDYSLKIFQNGAPTPIEIPLQGNLNPKETYVVAHPQADAQILSKANQTDVKMNFDGNDAVVLNKGISTYVDKIGEIGVNPGVGGWTVPPSGSTKSKDLRRKYPVDQGETDWNNGKNQWNSFPPDSSQNIKQHNNNCGSSVTNDITFDFANAQETGSNPKYFEFDIMVSANSNSTYLDNVPFAIQYNTTAFGQNIVQNNKITVTKGANFTDISYVDPDTMTTDDAFNICRLAFGVDYFYGTWNKTLITTSQQQLLHFKIEIQNCSGTTDLAFTDQSNTAMFTTYALSGTSDPLTDFEFYDNVYYGFDLNYTLCPPSVISSFTAPVYPGTYYTGTPTTEWKLTINGSNFGNSQGIGNVYFSDADTGGQQYIPLNAKDFLSWSDTKIEIRMPSIIDSFPIGVNPSNYTKPVPGSGLFYVKKNLTDSAISPFAIDIPYALKNSIDPLVPEGKIRLDLGNINMSDSVSITFFLDTSITNHPDPTVETTTRQVIKDWRYADSVYFDIGTDTAFNYNVNNPDGVSLIYFVNSFQNPTTLAQTTIYGASCGDVNGNKHVFPKEIDIAILRNPANPWFYYACDTALPAGMRDFYEVLLHEVGHAALLKHTIAPLPSNNPDELMFWQALLGPQSASDRRYIHTNDQAGVLSVIYRSKSLDLNSSSCNTQNIGTIYLPSDQSTGCAPIVGLNEKRTVYNNYYDFKIFPNPTENNFTVEFETKESAMIQFTIYDYTGKQVREIQKKQLQKGIYQEEINMEYFPNGFYFLTANMNGKIQTFKIIKM